MRSSFCNIHCVDQQPKSGLFRFIVEVFRSLTIICFRSPLRKISSSQRPLLNNTQQIGKTNNHALCGIRTSNPSNQETADLRLRSDAYLNRLTLYFSPHDTEALSGPGPPHWRGYTITLRHTSFGRILLDGWSARHSDLFLTTHNILNRHSFPGGIRTYRPTSVHPIDHAATGNGLLCFTKLYVLTLWV